MDIMEIIKQRRSVRTFDGKGITPEEQKKLYEYVQQIKNPYDIPVHFMLVDARSEGLFSQMKESRQQSFSLTRILPPLWQWRRKSSRQLWRQCALALQR